MGNLKITSKLLASYFVVMLLCLAAGISTGYSMAEAGTKSVTVMVLILATAVIISLLIVLSASNSITRPLRKTLNMIEEMGKGHLSNRLNDNANSETAQIAQAIDSLAEKLQKNVIGTMNCIAQGDVSMNPTVDDEKDEIGPSLKKMVETIRVLDAEVLGLIQSATEGKLDARGNADQFTGSWKDFIVGTNTLIDTFVGPLNLYAEYVRRISKGDIPEKITHDSKGYFNEFNISLNSCIDAVNALIDDSVMLSNAAVEGKLKTRADAARHGGDFAKIIGGMNETLDSITAPIHIMAEYLDKIGKGKIPDLYMNESKGDFNEMKNSMNSCISGLGCLIEGRDILLAMSENDYRNKVQIAHQGIFNEITESINLVSDRVNHTIEIMRDISQGDLKDIESLRKIGKRSDHDTLIPSMIIMMDSIKDMVEETESLSNSAIEGDLSKRGDVSRFKGEYAKVVEGINETLDAVTAPIIETVSVMKEMAKGNLHVQMKGDYQGDYMEVKDAIDETVANLQSYVNEISHVLSEISNRNLNIKVTADYKGDFSEIKDSLNSIILELNQTMAEIGQSAEQVASGSIQVSDGSQALAQGSTEQAASIEELTGAITEMAKLTKENTISAGEANEQAANAKINATKGNEQMKNMLKAMTEINESSENISKIIKVIDDIAFQTNILALNAAVEAARAGQHGKGFAVVAEEVRSLSARSAEAAKESTEQIENSISKVKAGTKIADDTASELNAIVSEIEKVAELVENIASESNRQATGIAEINSEIEQVSQVIQNNSATAEESAAASEELSSQSEILKDMVGQFKLNKRMMEGEKRDGMSLDNSDSREISIRLNSPTKAATVLRNNGFDKY